MSDDRRYWFAPKRFGYGAGLPIAWQGWALLAGFVAPALLLRVIWRLPHPTDRWVAVILTLAYALAILPIIRRRTRGGWRWRWGEAA